ncbi:MAG: winged helix DNA-binding protein [Gemmatimonadaceae bacterium]|nr:winged helix DNA-binding protein [Gemmatimonadaceae bacterium]
MTARPPAQLRPNVPGVSATADALHRSAITLLRAVRSEDEATGIGPAPLSALSLLVFVGPLPLGRLATLDGVRAPTMSRLIRSLERARLARRASDPADARRVIFTATPRGRRVILEGRARRLRRLQRALDALRTAELRALARALPALRALGTALDHLGPASAPRRRRQR